MNDSLKGVLDELVTILNKIKENRVYGSVELFFENGEITQITQRIIKKVKTPPSVVKTEATKKPVPARSRKEDLRRRTISTLE